MDGFEEAKQQEFERLQQQVQVLTQDRDKYARNWREMLATCEAYAKDVEEARDKARVATREREDARKERDAAQEQCAAAERGHNEAAVMLDGMATTMRMALDDQDPDTVLGLMRERLAAYDASIDTNAAPPVDWKGRAERAESEVEEWKSASGLMRGGDPDGVRPADLSAELKRAREVVEALRKDMDDSTEPTRVGAATFHALAAYDAVKP